MALHKRTKALLYRFYPDSFVRNVATVAIMESMNTRQELTPSGEEGAADGAPASVINRAVLERAKLQEKLDADHQAYG